VAAGRTRLDESTAEDARRAGDEHAHVNDYARRWQADAADAGRVILK
jgi:hypothetical protein